MLKSAKCDPAEQREQRKDEGVLYSPSSGWASQMGLRVPVTQTTVWESNFLPCAGVLLFHPSFDSLDPRYVDILFVCYTGMEPDAHMCVQ